MGCPSDDKNAIRLGVDRSLKPLGLARFLVAGFEEQSDDRVVVRYGGTEELLAWANAGELDEVLMVSESALDALYKEGLPVRVETYAHEELVLIGPFQNYLGRHAKDSGSRLLQHLARNNHLYFKGKKGSVEWARHQRLFRESGDREEPGAFFATEVEGVELVEKAIDQQAFAFVRRSSLLETVLRGKRPHRIYKEQDPSLVLRLVLAEIHPGKAKRPTRPEFFDYVMGEEGQKAVAVFGKDRFGYPLFAPGAPKEGEGAGVPKVTKEAQQQ